MRKDEEQQIRDLFHEKVSGVQPPLLGQRFASKIRFRRMLVATASVLTVIAVGVGGFVVAIGLSDDRVSPTNDAVGSTSEQLGEDDAQVTPLSSEFVVASGERAGEQWSVRAHRAEIERSNGSTAALCLKWDLPGDNEGDTACVVDLLNGLPENEVIVSQTSTSPFFGEVAREVAEIELRSEGGGLADAEIFEAPEGLGVDFDFFVGFIQSEGNVTLIAKDQAGDVLERETHASLPRLTVSKSGSGNGIVTGYSKSPGPAGIERRERIHCGTMCFTEDDGGSISLEATPAEGSTFSGWSEDCTGKGSCVVIMDDDQSVTANFEKTP